MLEKIQVWLSNLSITHHVAMANFLRRRDWVVFYLPEESRECVRGSCWLRLYRDEMKKENPRESTAKFRL